MQFRLHKWMPFSRANGPGIRAVVWFQGCNLGCPGCFNPGTHALNGGLVADTSELSAEIRSLGTGIDGVSISGGEPFQQPDALLKLLQKLTDGINLSVLVFSGYTLTEIERLPLGPEILRHVDVLVAGRYSASRANTTGLLGSLNQQIHFLTDRYQASDLDFIPPSGLVLHRDGTITVTGISPWTPDRD